MASPSTVVSYIIWYGVLISLIHQQNFVHNLVWVVFHWTPPATVVSHIIWYGVLHQSNPSTVFEHHLVWLVFHWASPSTVASYIIWCGFLISLIHHKFLTSSGMGSLSLGQSINSCIVHYLLWSPRQSQPSTVFVHHLVWIVFYGTYPSTAVSYIAWHEVLHHSNSSIVLRIILYGYSFTGLIHQHLYRTLSRMDPLSV